MLHDTTAIAYQRRDRFGLMNLVHSAGLASQNGIATASVMALIHEYAGAALDRLDEEMLGLADPDEAFASQHDDGFGEGDDDDVGFFYQDLGPDFDEAFDDDEEEGIW